MIYIYKIVIICMLWVVFPVFGVVSSSAQNLPLMPADPAVSTGALPNGMSYYLVKNPTSKGVADFALVQKTGHQTSSESGEMAFSVAQDAITALPRLGSTPPQVFLASNGVAPGKDGFVKVTENATLYHFSDVMISNGELVTDSTLVMLMDIADRGSRGEDAFLERWYAPSDQAVIVSGDIDPSSIAAKLKFMSYMTPSRESQKRKAYEWKESEEPVFETSPYMTWDLATVSATWTFPRTPEEYMNTVQPAIYEMFVSELGIIARERLILGFLSEEIPVADVSFQHMTSVTSLGDEIFTISVSVAPEHAAQAASLLASTMASLDNGTATVHELEMAKNRYLSGLEKEAANPFKSNADYVERCAFAFLYNSPLSSEKETWSFLRSRNLDVNTELIHFNNIASALLDSRRNLTVECRIGGGQEMGSAYLESVFSDAWADCSSCMPCPSPVDSIPLPSAGLPQKVKSQKRDPLSGGTVWTFENGFKVVYRRQESGHRMYYTLAMNGGYGNIEGLSKGEGAYMTDYMKYCSVSGISYGEFARLLEKEDITLEQTVNLSNVLVEGSAPDDKLDLMMRALLGVVNEREHDGHTFGYYADCQKVMDEYEKRNGRDRIVAIDSLMCPGYVYSSIKDSDNLTEGFADRADAFLKHQSSKMNDGLLVLVGNIEETRLKKFLRNYVGEFATTERTFPRTLVHYQPVSGASTYTRRGPEASVDFTISAPMSLTAENYMASQIAAAILRQAVSSAIEGTGMYLRLSHNCRIYPQERFNVMISLAEASSYGFSRDITLTGPEAALRILRNVIEDLPELEVREEDLAKYKAVLKGHLAVLMMSPQYWTHAVTMRYMDGKNFTTGYEAKIDAVSVDRVRDILSSLSDASRVEYIVKK